MLVPLASGPQRLHQALRSGVRVKLGAIGTLVFHPSVVRVLQIYCRADPCDGTVKANFPIDDSVGWLVRGLTTVDCLRAIWPGLYLDRRNLGQDYEKLRGGSLDT